MCTIRPTADDTLAIRLWTPIATRMGNAGVEIVESGSNSLGKDAVLGVWKRPAARRAAFGDQRMSTDLAAIERDSHEGFYCACGQAQGRLRVATESAGFQQLRGRALQTKRKSAL